MPFTTLPAVLGATSSATRGVMLLRPPPPLEGIRRAERDQRGDAEERLVDPDAENLRHELGVLVRRPRRAGKGVAEDQRQQEGGRRGAVKFGGGPPLRAAAPEVEERGQAG